MDNARSNLAIIDAPSVRIELSNLPDDRSLGLRLTYHGQKYNLVQAFASHKLELAQQQLQRQIDTAKSGQDRYLLVQELGYYSLWVLDPLVNLAEATRVSIGDLELQQASILLLQELWSQWQDLLGERQLQILVDHLLAANLRLKSRADLDRLLDLDALGGDRLDGWEPADFSRFDRQLCQLTRQKLGQQFGTKLTVDIIDTMPDSWRSILLEVLDIPVQ